MDRRSGLERFVVIISDPRLFLKNKQMETREREEQVWLRKMIWKDRPVKELTKSKVFQLLHVMFEDLDKEPIIFPMDDLIVLNEVGYEVAWLCYHEAFSHGADMDQFERNVYANMGIDEHAKVVFSMVHIVVDIVNSPALRISRKTRNKLRKLNASSWCARQTRRTIYRIKALGIEIEDEFTPHYTEDIVVEGTRCRMIGLKQQQSTYEQSEETEALVCAEPNSDEKERGKDAERVFALEAIVEYAKENLSLEMSVPIQNMLYYLLGEDGNKEEREMVASIPRYIINRGIISVNSPGNMIGNTINYGNKEE